MYNYESTHDSIKAQNEIESPRPEALCTCIRELRLQPLITPQVYYNGLAMYTNVHMYNYTCQEKQ